jgi:hypothetical protein
MIGPLDPDSLDPAVLRNQADLFGRIAYRSGSGARSLS